MSIQYNDTSGKKGLLQICERNCLLGDAGITGNATLKAVFTAELNIGMDDALSIIFDVGGTWNYDDSNHTDYPIITTNLVSGQRDYSFTTDEQGNLILDIYKVMVAGPDGVYREIFPVDQQTLNNNNLNTDTFINGQNSSGTPTRYDKTANGIFLDLIPNYNSTGGLKIFINRESSYFATSDTTKKPGFDGRCHEHPAIFASYRYAKINQLSTKIDLENDLAKSEAKIRRIYGKRERDIVRRIVPNLESCK